MLHYSINDWVPIQQRLVEAGYHDVPNGKLVDSYRVNEMLYLMVEFESDGDELWFKLRWE